jgi:hypothetical protein
MTSPCQSSYSNRNINTIVPAPRAQELFNSLFVPPSEPTCLSRRGSQSNPQPGTSSSCPITISSSASPSPSLLHPRIQLSTGTLFQSDFPTASDCFNTSNAPQDDPYNINTPSPNGRLIPGSWTVGRETSRDALEEYQKGYMLQVEDASKRLQKILGMRNEEAFKPPMPVLSGQGALTIGNAVNFNPALRHLRGSNADLGIKIGQVGSGLGPGRTNCEAAEEYQRGIGQGILQGHQRRVVEKPLALRESLLMHGRQLYGNQARTELRSLTFHDLTPDMRTGDFKNEMLAHFEADPAGRTRLVSYEVDVFVPLFPSPPPNPTAEC